MSSVTPKQLNMQSNWEHSKRRALGFTPCLGSVNKRVCGNFLALPPLHVPAVRVPQAPPFCQLPSHPPKGDCHTANVTHHWVLIRCFLPSCGMAWHIWFSRGHLWRSQKFQQNMPTGALQLPFLQHLPGWGTSWTMGIKVLSPELLSPSSSF